MKSWHLLIGLVVMFSLCAVLFVRFRACGTNDYKPGLKLSVDRTVAAANTGSRKVIIARSMAAEGGSGMQYSNCSVDGYPDGTCTSGGGMDGIQCIANHTKTDVQICVAPICDPVTDRLTDVPVYQESADWLTVSGCTPGGEKQSNGKCQNKCPIKKRHCERTCKDREPPLSGVCGYEGKGCPPEDAPCEIHYTEKDTPLKCEDQGSAGEVTVTCDCASVDF